MNGFHDGIMISVGAGPPTVTIIGSGPPRLWGDGCGCVRTKKAPGDWELELCDRHAQEYVRGKVVFP